MEDTWSLVTHLEEVKFSGLSETLMLSLFYEGPLCLESSYYECQPLILTSRGSMAMHLELLGVCFVFIRDKHWLA